MSGRYVALGSSMAAGPGIRPQVRGAPFGSGRSARNYAHLVAEQLNLDLVDVTFSGATTAHVLAERQRSARPQIEALDGSEELVTITIGGNDVGYVPLLMAATLPAAGAGCCLRSARDCSTATRASRRSTASATRCARSAPRCAGARRGPGWCSSITSPCCRRKECRPPPLSAASTPTWAATSPHAWRKPPRRPRRPPAASWCAPDKPAGDHHGWSAEPWAVAAGWPLPWRPAPFHPNAAGMRAVADLILKRQAETD